MSFGIKKIFDFYISGFRSMTTGKYLWIIILIKLFNVVLLSNALHFRTNTIAHILHIVLNIEPLIHMLLLEINAVRNLNAAIYEVFSFNIDQVRNLVILMAQEDSLN